MTICDSVSNSTLAVSREMTEEYLEIGEDTLLTVFFDCPLLG